MQNNSLDILKVKSKKKILITIVYCFCWHGKIYIYLGDKIYIQIKNYILRKIYFR